MYWLRHITMFHNLIKSRSVNVLTKNNLLGASKIAQENLDIQLDSIKTILNITLIIEKSFKDSFSDEFIGSINRKDAFDRLDYAQQNDSSIHNTISNLNMNELR